MGFFGALGKIVAGKPVFEPEQNGTSGSTPTPQSTGPMPAGPKAVPVVRFGRVECHASGPRIDVYADIHNESQEAIFLDRILLPGSKRELDSQLNPGQSRQYLIYSGPLLSQPVHGCAEVHYRKQSDGDYFAGYHEIRCKPEGAAGYVITELLLRGPARDI